MKVGNISQTVWRRSIKNQLDTKNENVITAFSLNGKITTIDSGDGKVFITALGKSFGKSSKTGLYAAVNAVSEIKMRKGEVISLELDITVPVFTSEAHLKSLVSEVKEYAHKNGIYFSGVTTEVNPAVNRILCNASVHAYAYKDNFISSSKAASGQDIVLAGSIGLEGMARIIDEKEEELGERFNRLFLRQCKDKADKLKDTYRADSLKDTDITSVMQIGTGGIMAALWNMTEGTGTGLEADMSKMTIDQETVEILEYYNLNPYEMTSSGSFLIVSKDGDEVVRRLHESGVEAVKIGITLSGNKKMITGKDEERFLDRPVSDELMNWWQNELSEV